MDKEHFKEMQDHFWQCEKEGLLSGRNIFLFGHCDATVMLADLLVKNGYRPKSILDNSTDKQGMDYKGIPIQPPDTILKDNSGNSVVLIATRFYESMYAQLRNLGFQGVIKKLVDYNTYAEYSLASETIDKKKMRVEYGKRIVEGLERNYSGAFRFFCPFSALGDIYFCMSYLPYYIKKRGIGNYVMCVAGESCADVVSLFSDCAVEVLKQADIDAAIQAELYMRDENFFIVHQDRPYVVNLSKALYLRLIPLEDIYRSGIFGLPPYYRGYRPSVSRWKAYSRLEEIEKDKAVILSPYAKSVTMFSTKLWAQIVRGYKAHGFQVYTNVTEDEQPLRGTKAISPKISEMKSVVERAGVFVGIRSGLCDVLRTADCQKIALYPDYSYCGTKWKSIDMYALDEFENIVVGEGFKWKNI